jgi:hypothetical protein
MGHEVKAATYRHPKLALGEKNLGKGIGDAKQSQCRLDEACRGLYEELRNDRRTWERQYPMGGDH